MHADFSFRQRASSRFSEAATRRLQTAFWLLILLLAVAINARTAHQSFRDTVELADMTPADAVSFRAHLASFGISNYTFAIVGLITTAGQNLVVTALGALLLLKRKGTDWFAWYIAITFVAGIGAIYPPDLRGLVDGQRGWVAIGVVTTTIFITSLFLLPMLFPTGRFVPRWMAVVGVGYLVLAASYIAAPNHDPMSAAGPAVEAVTDLLLLALILGSLIYRYRRKSDVVQRQQMKWGAVGLATALPAFLIGDAAMRNIDGTLSGVLAFFLFGVAVPVFTLVFPICLTVAILRYRLFEIDLFVSRTLVWLAMTALVIAAYAGIVFGIGSLFSSDQSTILSLLAIGSTAVLFQPVRQRVQRGIDRLFFGDRDDPYQVVRKLGSDLAETVQPIEALRATVRTLTEALRLPYAAVTLDVGAPPVAMAGHPGASQVPIPLVYQSQPVGELIVSPRSGSREFDAADRTLLDELARQIGVVAHNVRLTNDLQASRERIVTAREEERRRLRRDLHDGLGAQLAALTLQTGALKATIPTDPGAAVEQATELQQELRIAVADIRRLVQGLRPAALDDLGLIGAVGARITAVNLAEWSEPEQRPLLVALDAPGDLGPLSAAVEVALYRIVDEALINVVKHANASRCRVVLSRVPAGIRLVIEDDGRGIPVDRISGVGLQSMRERALELGGTLTVEPADPAGTRIVAELPVGDG
jgi:signal transduction histidine kinase